MSMSVAAVDAEAADAVSTMVMVQWCGDSREDGTEHPTRCLNHPGSVRAAERAMGGVQARRNGGRAGGAPSIFFQGRQPFKRRLISQDDIGFFVLREKPG